MNPDPESDPLERFTERGIRTLIELGFKPEFAELTSRILFFEALKPEAGSQIYLSQACFARVRDRKLREIHRRAMADIREIQSITKLSKSQLYKILAFRVR